MIIIFKERETRTENPYLDDAYDPETDEWSSIGFSLPNIQYELQRKNLSDEILYANQFNDLEYFEDHNVFDGYYGESI